MVIPFFRLKDNTILAPHTPPSESFEDALTPNGVSILERAAAASSPFTIGPVFHGAIFQLGIRLTIEEFDQIYLDYFTLSKECFVAPSSGRIAHHIVFNSLTETFNYSFIKSPEEVQTRRFTCSFGNKVYPFVKSPSYSVDSNVANKMHIWRCRLLGVQVEDLKRSSSMSSASYTVGVQLWNEMLFYNVPKQSLSLGSAGPESHPLAVPYAFQPRVKVTVCVAEVHAMLGARALGDWITHHSRLGVNNVVLLVKSQRNSSEVAYLLQRYHSYLTSGTLSLWFAPEQLHYYDSDVAKIQFYQACLFHSKSTSEFVGVWDLDEWWIPANLSSYLDQRHKALPQILNQLHHAPCPNNWCFLTFPSHNILPASVFDGSSRAPKPTSRNPLDFTVTETLQWTWKKYIVKSLNAYMLGFHSPGTCIINGTAKVLHLPFSKQFQNYEGNTDECVVIGTKYGYMNHYRYSLRELTEKKTKSPLSPCPFAEFVAKVGHVKLLGQIVD